MSDLRDWPQLIAALRDAGFIQNVHFCMFQYPLINQAWLQSKMEAYLARLALEDSVQIVNPTS
jgi:hypothetical protein